MLVTGRGTAGHFEIENGPDATSRDRLRRRIGGILKLNWGKNWGSGGAGKGEQKNPNERGVDDFIPSALGGRTHPLLHATTRRDPSVERVSGALPR
jgi:hypothetical protein